MKLFISYRSLDSAKVDTIVSRLQSMQPARGIPRFAPWQDKYGIPAGKDWWLAICEAIETCDIFVFMVSHESVQNINCRAELSYAFDLNKPILPIVLDGEHFYNRVTGKSEISFWDSVPKQLEDSRIQFLFYEGTSFVDGILKSINEFDNNPLRPLPATRPRDPRETISNKDNPVTLYDEACDYAGRLEFDTAKKLFRDLMNRNTEFANEAETWISILRDYETLLRYSKRKSLQYKLKESWQQYVAQFPFPFLPSFDPNNIWKIVQNLPTNVAPQPTIRQSSRTQKPSSSPIPNTSTVAQPQQQVALETPRPRPQAQAIQHSQSKKPSTVENPKVKRLNAWNPFDWLRLLYWLLLNPAQLANHRETYGNDAEKQTGSWLVATTVCIPVLLMLFPTALNAEIADTLSGTHNVTSSFIFLLIILTIGAFFATGIRDQSGADEVTLIWGGLCFSIAFGVALIVAFFVIEDTTEDKMLIIAFFVVTSIVVGLTIEEGLEEGSIVSGVNASILLSSTVMLSGVGLALGLGLFVAVNVETSISPIAVFAAATGALSFFLGVIPPLIWLPVLAVRKENIKRNKNLFWNYVISVVLVISYIVLIWNSISLSFA